MNMVGSRYLDLSMKVNALPVLNESLPLTGGDPRTLDVNQPYQAVGYHAVWVMACTALVWPIIPGIGFLYGGLARRNASLGLLWQSFLVSAVISFQWWWIGYSLAYSRTAGKFIGDFENIGLRNVVAAPSIGSGYIPEILFALFQCFFCVATVQIMIGGAFERGRLFPSLLFGFIWATVVYCPLACWTWNPSGWLYQLPSVDYAGGGPVHIASGFSALAYALVLGKRQGCRRQHRQTPHNVAMVFLGTCFIWFGWLCFNGGSTLNATIRSMYAMFNTNIAASCGIIGWVATDYFGKKGRLSVVGACEGAIAGLVGITPAAGNVAIWYAALIGFLTAVLCSLCEDINIWVRIDEGMDIFKLHGIGGAVGALLTGIFASETISLLDGMTSAPGAIDGNGAQVAKQLVAILAIASYSFTVSAVILLAMKHIPGLQLRLSEEAELQGLDKHEFCGDETGELWGYEKDMLVVGGITPHTTLQRTPTLDSQGAEQQQPESKQYKTSSLEIAVPPKSSVTPPDNSDEAV
ncbi:ammonium transporter MepA [Tuber borchii]|uniref:Ammonium transporter n=1 Tax=Tuber borchii TaxID=42251 RepID=A0A2T6ZWT8_TUBBO|nr:ammonium transporter MepA [Tuber borchii]